MRPISVIETIEPSLSHLTIASWWHDARRDFKLLRAFDFVVDDLARLLERLGAGVGMV
jgi:hypothetical protein